MFKYKTPLIYWGMIYATAVWGITFTIVKDSLVYINPTILVTYRFLIAAVVLGCFLLVRRQKLFANFKYGLIVGLLLWILYTTQTIGLKYTTASNSAFITGTFVLFVPLFYFLFLKKSPTRYQLMAVLISIFGLWFLTGGIPQINKGDLLTIITAMTNAGYILYAGYAVAKKSDPYVLAFQSFLSVGLLGLGVGLVWSLPFRPTDLMVLKSVVLLALLPTLSAFVIQFLAQKSIDPVKLSFIIALEPVFAAVYAWTFGGESLLLGHAFGGMLVVVAMFVSALSESGSDKTILKV